MARGAWLISLMPLAWLAVWLGLNVHSLGVRFAYLQQNIGLDYAMGVFWWMILAAVLLLVGGESREMLLLAWVGKFVVTLVAMLFYEQHYGLDSYTYFETRLTGRNQYCTQFDFNEDLLPSFTYQETSETSRLSCSIGAANSARSVMWVGLVTGPYFHAIKVGYAFLGLLGIWGFYGAVVVALGRPYPPAFYLMAFFPSIIFWSSIFGKDPLQFLFQGLYAYGGAIWLAEGRLAALGALVVGLLGSYIIRPWIAIMGGMALALATLLGRCRPWQTALVFAVCTPVVIMASSQLQLDKIEVSGQALSSLAAQEMLVEFIRSKTEGVAADTKTSGGSGDDLSKLTGDGDALVSNLPVAIFSGLFRPLPFDITNPFTALAAVENTVILALAISAVFHLRREYVRDPFLLWTVSYVLLWTSTHGFIVMANFGSGVRYKLQVMPFLLMAILLLAHREGRALLYRENLRRRGS